MTTDLDTAASANGSAPIMRWRLHRAGIVNVYQYENEILDFAGGRLLLRGVNGSGKSTAMNMLLPFLLTARVRGIDAAGEQTGVLKSWMLSGRDEAQPVGYLWLEFARPATGSTEGTSVGSGAEHLVIGCGIKANRSTDNVSTWWFVTGRRPGVDLDLVERGVPLSADALRSAIDPDPVFSQDRRGEYRREVNRRLFGGADTEPFLDLLNAVRSPRVGDRVDVDLPEHLVAALPGLSEQALTEAARPLDDLDEHRRNVSDLDATAIGLAAIEEVYRNYVRTEVRRESATASDVLGEAERARRTERADARTETEAADAEAQRDADVARVESDIARLTAEIDALEKSPAYTEGQQLDDLRHHVEQLRADATRDDARASELADRVPVAVDGIRVHERRASDEHARLVDALRDLDASAADVSLNVRPPTAPTLSRRPIDTSHDTGDGDDLHAPDGDLDVAMTTDRLEAVAGGAGLRRADIDEVRSHLASMNRETAELRAAEAASTIAERNEADAVESFEQARNEVGTAREEWDDAVRSWATERAMPVAARLEADVATLRSVATPPVTDAPTPIVDRPALRRALAADVAALADIDQRNVIDDEYVLSSAEAALANAQAVVDDLAARTEPEPPLLDWQERRGPGLADLVDFADHLDDSQCAGLEAALEASGLLTAIVSGDGLRLDSGELVATPTGRASAPLSDVLRVTAEPGHDNVAGDDGQRPDEATVVELLASISTDPDGGDASMVSVDGHFRLGSLCGRHHKTTAEFVGVGARRLRLERQRDEAAAVLHDARVAHADAVERLHARRAGHAATVAIREALPGLDTVDATEATAAAAQSQLDRSREQVRECRGLAADAEQRAAAASDELHRVARTLQLPIVGTQLDAIARTLDAIVAATREVRQNIDALRHAHHEWTAAVERWRTVVSDAAEATSASATTRREHDVRAARLATLEDTLGVAYHEVVAALDVARDDLDGSQRSLPDVRDAHTAAVRTSQAAVDAAERSTDRRRLAEVACVDAHRHLVAVLDVPGLLAAATAATDVTEVTEVTEVKSDAPVARSIDAAAVTDDAPTEGAVAAAQEAGRAAIDEEESGGTAPGGTTSPATWPAPEAARPDDDADTVDAFRLLIERAQRVVPAPTDAGTTADGVRISLRQRRNALGAGWDAEDRQPVTALPMSVTVNGPLGQMTLAASVVAVRSQLSQLLSLLTQKQDQALRTLLQGMIAREVAEKMHHASALVELMNERLGSVTTAHGIGVRLRWRRSDDLDDDTARTVSILAKLPDLRTEAEEADLREALAARLDEARRLEPDAPYRHLIGQVFDYRRWHDMAVLLRRSGDTERRLGRRTPLSEGEKKLVTYLPLFAAVAASCDSIAETGAADAPRFLLLDDAFAKVSEDNHAALFGLLVDLDLDFIATSERLWGTHATVPELSITEVVRDADLGAILLEHSRWNGRILT